MPPSWYTAKSRLEPRLSVLECINHNTISLLKMSQKGQEYWNNKQKNTVGGKCWRKQRGHEGGEAVFVTGVWNLKFGLNTRCFLLPNSPLYQTDQVQFLLIAESGFQVCASQSHPPARTRGHSTLSILWSLPSTTPGCSPCSRVQPPCGPERCATPSSPTQWVHVTTNCCWAHRSSVR